MQSREIISSDVTADEVIGSVIRAHSIERIFIGKEVREGIGLLTEVKQLAIRKEVDAEGSIFLLRRKNGELLRMRHRQRSEYEAVHHAEVS